MQKWILIGASQIAEKVIPAIRLHPQQEIVGVFSHSAERARTFAQQNNIAQHSDDLVQLLKQTSPDIAYISSTNEYHYPQTLVALAAGCHVLCEKPLAMNLREAGEMCDSAQQHAKVLATNHHLRALPAHHWVRNAIAQGVIGKVHSVQLSHAVYLPELLQGWRLTTPQAGGGVVLDIVVHDADLLRFLLAAEPQSVMAMDATVGMAHGGLEDNAMQLIRFNNGVLAQMHQSFAAPHTKNHMHIMGDKGAIFTEGSLSQSGEAKVWLRDSSGERLIPTNKSNLYHATVAAFLSAIDGSGHPLSSAEDGMLSLKVALAALESARTRAAVMFV